ncbi:hypothetical protein JAO32_19930, partial [Terriglobus sp. ADX1]
SHRRRAFGRNHLRVYRALEQAGAGIRLAACADPSESARAAVAPNTASPSSPRSTICSPQALASPPPASARPLSTTPPPPSRCL